MIAVALIAALAATALLTAASLRLDSLVSSLLAAYIVGVVEVAALTTALSPVRAVTRGGLAAGEVLLLVAAFAAWWLRGRPRPSLQPAAHAARVVVRDPVTLALLLLCAATLAYELVLVLAAPANNWDSLTYHLARAAAWAQHGGVHWIENAPTDRMNEFQPLAEQEVLFLFVASASGALFALPQFAAQVAILLGIYGIARRLGHEIESAACAALLFSTFTVVALEATTAQNDLVAASLPVSAAALLLGQRRAETGLAGIAAGIAMGVKLTTAFVLPVLLALAVLRGRRPLAGFTAATAAAFVALGMWGFVRNLAETGHLLGQGGGRAEHTADPSLLGTASSAFRITYRLLDLSGFDDWMVWALALLGLGAALAVLVARWGRSRPWAVFLTAAVAALPLLAPALVLSLAAASRRLAEAARLPVDESRSTSAPFSWAVNRDVAEDFSSFGPLGALVLAVSLAVVVAAARRRVDPRRFVLALALPFFVGALAVAVKYNPWLSRFLIVPMALTAPLLAVAFRRRGAALSIAVVAVITVALAHSRNLLKPIEGAPWRLTQAESVELPWLRGLADAQRELERLVPSSRCMGALLDPDDPTFLLYGDKLQRRLTFLSVPGEWQRAEREGLGHIIVNGGDYQDAQARLKAQGWKLQRLADYWVLATSPISTGPCPPPVLWR